MEFECVQPIEEAARLIMQWRNDPQTRRMSFHGKEKIWPAFWNEFLGKYFLWPDLPSLFVLEGGQRVGFVSFEPVESPLGKCCEISFMVAPASRGRGIGRAILEQCGEWVLKRGYDVILGRVKEENEASWRSFASAGYEEISSVDVVIEGEGVFRARRFVKRLREPKAAQGVYIIAEIGSNWQKDVGVARELIDGAVAAGADAAKFQVFRPESIYVKDAGASDYLSEAGIHVDMRELFAGLVVPYEMIGELAEMCRERGVDFLASVFSQADFEAVNPYVRMHKLASYEISHVRLIELMARSGKPLLMSTGAASEDDIAWAVGAFRDTGGKDLTLLQCTAKYPAPVSEMNLRVMERYRRKFGCEVGLSDHSRHPVWAPLAAVALGAKVVEKHMTLSRDMAGPDHAFAVTPAEMKEMVLAIREVEQMLGSGFKKVEGSEEELYWFARRGVQAVKAIRKGDVFVEGENVEILRPGKQKRGVHPKYLAELLGKQAKRNIDESDGVQQGDW